MNLPRIFSISIISPVQLSRARAFELEKYTACGTTNTRQCLVRSYDFFVLGVEKVRSKLGKLSRSVDCVIS